MGSLVIVNPGTGPVQDATEADAEASMRAFCAELAIITSLEVNATPEQRERLFEEFDRQVKERDEAMAGLRS